MKKYVDCWFDSLSEASKKDRKNIMDSYNKLPEDNKFETEKLNEVLSPYEKYSSATEEDKELCRMDFNSFAIRGRPYLRLKMGFDEYDKLGLFMSQFR